MKIFIVIPAFNEMRRIGVVLEDLKKVNMPIIVVDDGSRDSTYEKIKKHHRVAVIKHRINLGKGAALKTGCEAAFLKGADAVILMDSDGQHKASDLPKFVERINSGYDVVFGSRNLSMGVPFVRYMGNKMAAVLINIMFGIYVSDLICGFRSFTKKAYEKIRWQSAGYDVETEMVILTSKHNLKYCEVGIDTVYYDKFKGVTILDAISILFNVLKWRLSK